MIIKPMADIGIDAYPDADFAGLYGYEDNNDPVCVHSHMGCHLRMSHLLAIQTSDGDSHFHHGS